MSDGQRILIVDDDLDFSESNRDLLEAAGYVVETAPDGAQGLVKARSWRPDLMILDVMMTHDTEGFEVARAIPDDPALKGLKVVLVTGIRQEKGLAYAFEPDPTWLPVEQVLEKPVPPEMLLKVVEQALAG